MLPCVTEQCRPLALRVKSRCPGRRGGDNGRGAAESDDEQERSETTRPAQRRSRICDKIVTRA